MPAASRLGDTCTGHGCWPSRPNTAASASVFVNGRGWHRLGDGWAVHCCPAIPECHGGSLGAGSASVFINGRAAGRVGDAVSCGSSAASGSANVFAG